MTVRRGNKNAGRFPADSQKGQGKQKKKDDDHAGQSDLYSVPMLIIVLGDILIPHPGDSEIAGFCTQELRNFRIQLLHDGVLSVSPAKVVDLSTSKTAEWKRSFRFRGTDRQSFVTDRTSSSTDHSSDPSSVSICM